LGGRHLGGETGPTKASSTGKGRRRDEDIWVEKADWVFIWPQRRDVQTTMGKKNRKRDKVGGGRGGGGG